MSDTSVPTSPKGPSSKFPPPPKLKLDAFKPILSTTATNTSSNSSSNPSTAFVFTSSRTTHSGLSSASGSPATPPASPSTDLLYAQKPRPTLTASQLARHSLGALDARCIVGPSMRAAGFVPLAHNLSPHSYPHQQAHPLSSLPTSSGDGAPSSSGSTSTAFPTPTDPPPFPPIMFVNPTAVTAVPMWDYQKQSGWSTSGGKNVVGLSISSPQSSSASPLGPAFVPMSVSEVQPSTHHLQSGESYSSSAMSSRSASSAGIFSPIPSSSSMSSVPSALSELVAEESLRQKSVTRTSSSIGTHSPLPVVDGYPFPHTPPRSRTESRSPAISTASSTGISAYTTATERSPLSTYAIPVDDSTSVASSVTSASWKRTSTIRGDVSAARPLPAPVQAVGTKPPSFRQSARMAKEGNRPSSQVSQLSLTELCDRSSRAWVAEPDVYGPFLPKNRSESFSGSSVSGSSSSGKASRERRQKDTVDAPVDLAGAKLMRKQSSSSEDKVGAETRAKLEQGREWDRLKQQDNKQKDKHRTKQASQGSVVGLSKDKSRSKKHRTHSAAQSRPVAYSSFSFPPTLSVKPSAPHRLGEQVDHVPEPREHLKQPLIKLHPSSKERRERERAHHKGKDLGALVQAHRLHDREQARQSEREHRDDRERSEIEDNSKSVEIDDNWGKFYKHSPRANYPTTAISGGRMSSYANDPTSDGQAMLDLELLQTPV
ncbi:unnamed protein product [Somion occarium]|uniref:Proteophosphoglycan ppg4 n=1 Tax=Somion occarium TaxID=3059160 RepID=A0ABP1D2L0_9APHY